MFDHRYNRSAEVVLYQPTKSPQVQCLEECLKNITPQHRALLFQFYGCKRTRSDFPATLGLSNGQMKKDELKLKKCLRECIEKAEKKAFSQ
jgi:hypothetical protein